MKQDNELLQKAKDAKSAEELLSFAKENGVELTEDEAAEYFAQMHKSGELSDEELDNVAGGGCHKKDGRLIVTLMHSCDNYVCKCGRSGEHTHHVGNIVTVLPSCKSCKYCSYEGGLWLCNNPNKIK